MDAEFKCGKCGFTFHSTPEKIKSGKKCIMCGATNFEDITPEVKIWGESCFEGDFDE